jgi:hypothetical protein
MEKKIPCGGGEGGIVRRESLGWTKLYNMYSSLRSKLK